MLGTGVKCLKALSHALLPAMLFGVVGAHCAIAQSSENGNEALRQAFIDQYGQRFRTNKLAIYIASLYRNMDYDGQGLDRAEIELFKRIWNAQARGHVASRILRYDLDGDGVVTREEIEKVMSTHQGNRKLDASGQLDENTRRRIAAETDNVLAGDPNNDGRIEPGEYAGLTKHDEFARHEAGKDHAKVAEALLALDPNGDGKVTQVEALQIVGNAFGG